MTLPTNPLYVIFEQHLYNFPDADIDRKTFIANVLKDYFSYMRRMRVIIPQPLEGAIAEELAVQVNQMLVKKIYGCLTIEDFKVGVPAQTRRRARVRYSRLIK